MDIQKRALQHLSYLLLTAAVSATWPSHIQPVRVMGAKKFMTIQTSKMDPPRLAFDEVHLTEAKTDNEWESLSKQGTPLAVGDQISQFSAPTPLESFKTRKIVLQPMTFSHAEVEEKIADTSWVKDLPANEQKRLDVAEQKFGTLEEDWSVPSFRQMAAEKIAEAKKEISSDEREAPKVIVQAVRQDGSVVTPDSIHTAGVEIRPNQHYELHGLIEVKGLPSGHPQWQMQIARYDDSIKKEDGRIDMKSGSFQISVPQMRGTLEAEMVDTKSGDVLGRGTLRLDSSDWAKAKPKITIAAINNQITTSYDSFYSDTSLSSQARLGRSKPVPTRVLFASVNSEGQTDKNGVYSFDQIQNGSWGLLRTEAKGFQPGIYMVQSGDEKRLPLFPESMIRAMKQIISDQALRSEVPETGSVVWGQVLQQGRPLAGVQVSVEDYENYQPVYFNSLLIPDPQLKATSENGFFAFVHLPAGFHSIVANYGPSYISHANVVVDDNTVSIARLQSTLEADKASVKVFGAFSGQPASAGVEMQSLPSELNVNGYAEVNLSPIRRLSLMRVHPQGEVYSDSLQLYEDTMDSIDVPLVRTDWLQSLMAARKISVQPDTGVIVGFVSDINFAAYLGHDPNFPSDQIVYFDPSGNIVAEGVPGGGFAIFNVPTGVQSIVIANLNSERIQTQVAPVDPSSLVVLKFR